MRIHILFLMLLLFNVSFGLALEEVASYRGSFNVSTGDGRVIIGPENNTGGCGNGVIDSGEQCDGANLNGNSCSSLLGNSGTLSCKANCVYETSLCTSSDNGGNGNNGGGNNGGSRGGSSGGFTHTPTFISGCVENWECSDWESCVAGSQVRICTAKNNCKTTFLKPEIQRSCVSNIAPVNGAVVGLGGGKINILLILGLLAVIVLAMIVIKVFSAGSSASE